MSLLKSGEIKKQYDVSRHELYTLEEAGEIAPIYTKGGQRRYKAQEIEALFAPQQKQDDKVPAVTPRSMYREFGTAGIREWGGSAFEDKLREMRGLSGRLLRREMRMDDPVISAVFFALVNSLRAASKRIAPASEKPADKEAAEFISQCIDDMSYTWADTFTLILDPMFEQGFSYLELVYKPRLGDKGKVTSQYDDGKVGWRKWAPRPAETLYEGNEWMFDEAGGVQAVKQVDENGQIRIIPIQKALHFRTTVHPAGNPEGVAIHRPAYIPYYYTKQFQEIEGIGVERTIAGLPVVYLGRDRTMEGSNSDYELAKDLVTNIRYDEQMGIVFPGPKMGSDGTGFLFELVSPLGRQQWDIDKIINRYDQRKTLVVLAQFIMLGLTSTGSFALARQQADLFSIAAEAWLISVADIINRHAIPKLIKYNNFSGLSGMPQLVFDSVGLPDLSGISEFINKLVDKQVITPDDELERHLRQIAGLPQQTNSVAAENRAMPEDVEPSEDAEPNEDDDTEEIELSKQHTGQDIGLPCPFCGLSPTKLFADHKNLGYCAECQKTFDPESHYGRRWQYGH